MPVDSAIRGSSRAVQGCGRVTLVAWRVGHLISSPFGHFQRKPPGRWDRRLAGPEGARTGETPVPPTALHLPAGSGQDSIPGTLEFQPRFPFTHLADHERR